jgi:hypothetical protein
MADHEIVNGRLQRFPGGSWAANCTCGWFGPIRAARLDAAQEWVLHVEHRSVRAAVKAAEKACAA